MATVRGLRRRVGPAKADDGRFERGNRNIGVVVDSREQ